MITNRRGFIGSLVAGGVGARAILGSAAGQERPLPAGIRPFSIDFGPDRIRDLHRRLDATRWPETFETGWAAGANIAFVRDTANYWRHRYDWAAQQARLNRLPQYRASFGGEGLHFVHWRAADSRSAMPLIVLHGWPSSFVEYVRPATTLAQGVTGAAAFDVVVPSLPGFALSDAPKAPGMHFVAMADRFHQLMQNLGYSRYGVVGIDFGQRIAMQMARAHPEAVTGLHIGAPTVVPEFPSRPLTPEEEAFATRYRAFERDRMTYNFMQRTEPQSLAIAQQDSPAGFLGWVLERYWDWTDHGEDLWATVDRDTVLTSAMLYWLPGRVLSAARAYFENAEFTKTGGSSLAGPINVPTWITRNPKDPWAMPPSLMDKAAYPNLVKFHTLARGGHFPALEHPEIWAQDVSEFFSGL